MKNNNTKYILITLCLTLSLMLFQKKVLNNSQSTLRNLFDSKFENYICDEAGSRLEDKYKTNFNEKRDEDSKLSKSQNAIIKFARDSTYKNIKPFVKKLAIFFVFIVLDIIFIGLWISYCCCCCCNCCLFKRSGPSKMLSFIFFLIATICCVLVIICSIVVLGTVRPFLRRVNGTGCSAFKFIDHVRDGLSPSYSARANEWVGIRGIKDRLNSVETEKKKIQNDKRELNTKGVGEQCKNAFKVDEDGKIIDDLISSSFSIDFTDQINNLDDALNTFDDTDDDIGEDVYDAMHDYVNKYVKMITFLIYSLTLVFAALGIAFLFLYCFFKNGCMRIIYVVIWNISMFIMYYAIMLSAVFGILGTILKDGAAVGQYIISSENIESNDPLIFKTDSNYVSNIIDTCANGNGSFTHIIQDSGYLTDNLDDYKTNIESFRNKKTQIQSSTVCNDNEKDKLNEYYDGLIDISNRAVNVSTNLTDIKCGFAKNDKNIILNEIESGGKKALVMSAFGFLAGIFLGISILAGIFLVHKYRVDEDNNQPGRGTDDKNRSNSNINENITDLNLNNNMMKQY